MDDAGLWQAFCSHSLTHAEWTHEAHVRVASLFVQRYELDEAHLRMRAGIIRMNERHGLVESPGRGYFETLTRVWLVLVADARRRCLRAAPDTHRDTIDSRELLMCCPELLDRALPERHYSKARLKSVTARAIFLEPDVLPLPIVSAQTKRDGDRS